jgi:CRISPR-associated protein Csd1
VTFFLCEPSPRFLVDRDDWHDWWRQFRAGLKKGPSSDPMLSFVSGRSVEPAATHPKIAGLTDVGGMSSGVTLASFDKEAFCSYGLEQSANAAMSEEEAATYRAALDELIRERSRRLAGVKIAYWYAGNVPKEFDPLSLLEDPPDIEADEANAQHRAGRLLDAIRTGGREDLLHSHYRYYALTLSANASRVMVRDWIEEAFEELASNIDAWFDGLSIVRRDGKGPAPRPKFLAVLGAIARDLADVPAPIQAKLWRVAVRREAIPEVVMAQALARVRSDIVDPDAVPNHARMGLLKAYRIRKGDIHMQSKLNDKHPEPAYHCGRLMAVLADIQYAALGDVGANVVQRYYAAASATPALVFGRLMRTAQFHLDKVRGDKGPGLAVWYDDKLACIWSQIRDRVPATLSLEEQTLFALGYYQQKAANRGGGNSGVNAAAAIPSE